MQTRAQESQAEYKKVPIFTATKSLDVKYKFNNAHENAVRTVPGVPMHALLFAGYAGLIDTRSSLTFKNGNQVYTASVDDTNFATAAITVLFTDTSTEEGALGEDVSQKTFSVRVEGKSDRILSSLDFYTEDRKEPNVAGNKAARDTDFNFSLMRRISTFSAVSARYDYPGNMVSTPAGLDQSIKGQMFHETFHHSEQALMHYLSTAIGLKNVLKEIRDSGAVYVYGMALDIFTQRMLCHNCNGGLLGMQHSQQAGFLSDLGNALAAKDIQPRPAGMMLDVRASAKQAAKQSATMEILRLPDDSKVVHEYNPDENIPRVLQAENRALGTEEMITRQGISMASYSGSFFVSSSFKKDKLETAIKDNRPAYRRT